MTAPQTLRITAIVAMARDRVIGRDGRLPWRLPEDLRAFREITFGHPVIVGRVTFEGLGGPLPGRPHVVLTSGSIPAEYAKTCHPASSPRQAVAFATQLARAVGVDEAFVIGGAKVYEAMMPWTTRLLITQIDADVEGDARFPDTDMSLWSAEFCGEWRRDPESGLTHRYLRFERRAIPRAPAPQPEPAEHPAA